MIEHDHASLTVFGIGAEQREAEWRGVVRQLLARGLLAVEGEYGTLALTEASGAVLAGRRQVMLRREPEPAARAARRARAAKAASAEAAELPAAATALFERLRAWRAATAREQGVPAYVIFHDATLRQIAAERAGQPGRAGRRQRRRREQAGQVRTADPGHGQRRGQPSGRSTGRPAAEAACGCAGTAIGAGARGGTVGSMRMQAIGSWLASTTAARRITPRCLTQRAGFWSTEMVRVTQLRPGRPGQGDRGAGALIRSGPGFHRSTDRRRCVRSGWTRQARSARTASSPSKGATNFAEPQWRGFDVRLALSRPASGFPSCSTTTRTPRRCTPTTRISGPMRRPCTPRCPSSWALASAAA